MITIKEFLEAVGYQVTGGSEYGWKCYGPNARYLDSDSDSYSASIVFDTVTQVVYETEIWDNELERSYRWIHPDFIKAVKKECKKRKIKYKIAIDDRKYIDIDVEADILEKTTAIVRGEEYDERVMIELDIPDDELLLVARAAHALDITLNEFFVKAIEQVVGEPKK